MTLDNAYSITGFALAFKELDENNSVEIAKVPGSGWDELRDVVVELLHGMKCDVRVEETDHSVQITVAE